MLTISSNKIVGSPTFLLRHSTAMLSHPKSSTGLPPAWCTIPLEDHGGTMSTAPAKPDYGIDAPGVIRTLLLIGALALLAAPFVPRLRLGHVLFVFRPMFLGIGAVCILEGILMILYARYGKRWHRDRSVEQSGSGRQHARTHAAQRGNRRRAGKSGRARRRRHRHPIPRRHVRYRRLQPLPAQHPHK